KLLIWDYIFEPVKELVITFSGKHTETFYKKINELIRTVFNVPDAYVQEKTYNWEKGENIEKFEIDWEVNKILDMYTYINVEISLKGFSSGGEGKVVIKIKPNLITEYPQDTIWQRNIIYEMLRRFWHKFFYHRKRMEYLNFGKELIVSFESGLKHYAESLGQTEGGTA
ncbi:MAG: hypothetical protein QXD48_03590, partial [Candidatus Aenigmatarchaeota archaeon]